MAALPLDLSEFTNSEIEEMGLPTPCPCLMTYREYDDFNTAYEVCVECGASRSVFTSLSLQAWC